MRIEDIEILSKKLRDNLNYYSSCQKQSKILESYSYLPIIKHCCEALGLDWQVVTGNTNGYVFNLTVNQNDLTVMEKCVQTAEKPEITVTEQVNGYCLNPDCQKDLSNRRKGTKYCNQECKNACLR